MLGLYAGPFIFLFLLGRPGPETLAISFSHLFKELSQIHPVDQTRKSSLASAVFAVGLAPMEECRAATRCLRPWLCMGIRRTALKETSREHVVHSSLPMMDRGGRDRRRQLRISFKAVRVPSCVFRGHFAGGHSRSCCLVERTRTGSRPAGRRQPFRWEASCEAQRAEPMRFQTGRGECGRSTSGHARD